MNNLSSTSILELIPKLPFINFWIHESCPLDVDLADLATISLPPLTWSESNKKPLEMTIKNTDQSRNKTNNI